MDVADLKMDEDKIDQGHWFNVDGDTELKVRYLGNEDVQNFLAKRRSEIDGVADDIKEDLSREILAELMSKHILIDWKNLEVNEEEREYSQELAEELLNKIDGFFDLVFNLANKQEVFREENAELDIKN